jgi:hypothetical protein
MLRKFLFVGLGGSGGKTLRFLRHDLELWLRQIGWKGEFPTAWQMLHIDTPTTQDGIEITEVPLLPAENYVGLVGPGIEFGDVAEVLSRTGGDGWREQASWRVDPTFLNVPIATGAGQYRAVGRTIGLAYADKVYAALQRASRQLATAEAAAQLGEIHQMAYGTHAAPAPEPVAVVVSSLAGGTGAGLLLDACDLLRQLDGTWADNSFGILYGSDVFQDVNAMSTSGIQPNTLAALSELMNGYWLTDNSPRVNPFFSAAGAPRPISRSGPAFPFLVGASNTKGVTFGDQRSVYAMMGRALRSWTMDPSVQIDLIQYTQANWQNNAKGNEVTADVLTRNHLPVFEAFGYAEVNLGLERFERYASERLARSAAVWLHDAHMVQARSNNDDESRPPAAIIDELARQQLIGFLQRAQLHERSQDNNDIIDALRPDEATELFNDAYESVLRLATGGVGNLDRQAWVNRICPMLEGAAEEYERDYDERLRTRVRTWVDTAPDQVIEVTTELAGRLGLGVTRRTIELVIEELNSVAHELADEAQQFLGWSADARGAVEAAVNANGRIPGAHPCVGDGVNQGLWTRAGYRADAKRRQVAAQLMQDFCEGFLVPLSRSLSAAEQDLHIKGFVGEGITQPTVLVWPERSVPDSLRPPKNEQLVLRIDDFPRRYEELVGRSTEATLAEEQPREARTAVISGHFLEELDAKTAALLAPLVMTARWSPDPSLMLGGGAMKSPATFRTSFAPEDVLDRASRWLKRPGTAFERFLEADLRSYLDDDKMIEPVERAERRSDFRVALQSALDSAEPLVQLDPALLSLLHGKAGLPQRAVPSQLPFRDHPIEAEVREILRSRLGPQADLDRLLTTAIRVREISVTSTLGAAHDPLVFSSITSPVIAGWGAVADRPAAKTSFWSNRRARPISQFVPVSAELLVCMTRGWFTGLMLGKIDRQALTIASNESTAAFPNPLLTPIDMDSRDLLPGVLESLGLAYSDVARLHSLAPIAAYIAVRELGVAPGLQSYQAAHEYPKVNPAISHWLKTGDYGLTLATPLAAVETGSVVESLQTRREAMLSVLRQAHLGYTESHDLYQKKGGDDPTALGSRFGLWPGMYPVIHEALQQLTEAVEAFSDQPLPVM